MNTWRKKYMAYIAQMSHLRFALFYIQDGMPPPISGATLWDHWQHDALRRERNKRDMDDPWEIAGFTRDWLPIATFNFGDAEELRV